MTQDDILKATFTSDVMWALRPLYSRHWPNRGRNISEEIPEMIASVAPISSGFALTDPQDPRYKYLTQIRSRYGNFLHNASVSLRQQGEENTVDAVQILVRLLHVSSLPSCTQFY